MKLKLNTDKNDVFFISDFHLFHKNILRFDNRPFDTVEEMHETLITNWNKTVSNKDTVFYLGDLCFANWEKALPLVERLNGTIHFIMGNHDRYEDIKKYKRFNTINDYVDLVIKNSKHPDYHFTLFHYPIYSWNRAKHGSFMVHGHCHHNLHHGEDASFYVNRRAIDVGCNGIDYTPISYLEAIDLMENNFIK